MTTYINFQAENELKEATVNSQAEFEEWVAHNIRTRGNKLYVVLPGENSKDFFVTSSPLDIEIFFDYLNMDTKFFIQEFAYGDYKDALGYLADLFEVSEPTAPMPDITVSFN